MKNIYKPHKVELNLGFVTGVEYVEPYQRYSTPHNYVDMKGEAESLNFNTPKQLKNHQSSIARSKQTSNNLQSVVSPSKANKVPSYGN